MGLLVIVHGAKPIAGNVWVCAVAGIGGFGNEAKRNAKTDQLRPVPRYNLYKETKSNEDTEPRHCTNLLLAACAPVRHLIRCPTQKNYLFGQPE